MSLPKDWEVFVTIAYVIALANKVARNTDETIHDIADFSLEHGIAMADRMEKKSEEPE